MDKKEQQKERCKAQKSLNRLYSLRKGIKNEYPFSERKKTDKLKECSGIVGLIERDKGNIQQVIDDQLSLTNEEICTIMATLNHMEADCKGDKALSLMQKKALERINVIRMKLNQKKKVHFENKLTNFKVEQAITRLYRPYVDSIQLQKLYKEYNGEHCSIDEDVYNIDNYVKSLESELLKLKNDGSNDSMFITLEGCEGAGKSTVAKLLKEHYEKRNFNVILTREPGGCKRAEAIRKEIMDSQGISVEEEIRLFAKARKFHCEDVILPAMKQRKTIIICDRYIHSNYAYQGYLNDYGQTNAKYLDMVKRINEEQNVVMPNLVFFIDVNPKVGLKRISDANRHTNRFDKFDMEKHNAIYKAFILMSAASPDKIIRINGEQEPANIVKTIINYIDK